MTNSTAEISEGFDIPSQQVDFIRNVRILRDKFRRNRDHWRSESYTDYFGVRNGDDGDFPENFVDDASDHESYNGGRSLKLASHSPAVDVGHTAPD